MIFYEIGGVGTGIVIYRHLGLNKWFFRHPKVVDRPIVDLEEAYFDAIRPRLPVGIAAEVMAEYDNATVETIKDSETENPYVRTPAPGRKIPNKDEINAGIKNRCQYFLSDGNVKEFNQLVFRLMNADDPYTLIHDKLLIKDEPKVFVPAWVADILGEHYDIVKGGSYAV